MSGMCGGGGGERCERCHAEARRFAEMAVLRLCLGSESQVVEISDSGSMLARSFHDLGIRSVALRSLDAKTAKMLVAEEKAADLIWVTGPAAGARHLPAVAAAMKILLKPDGVIALDVPRLERRTPADAESGLVRAVRTVAAHGLEVFDREELAAHSGWFRMHFKHAENDAIEVSKRVRAVSTPDPARAPPSVS
jgi:hypothetical protein